MNRLFALVFLVIGVHPAFSCEYRNSDIDKYPPTLHQLTQLVLYQDGVENTVKCGYFYEKDQMITFEEDIAKQYLKGINEKYPSIEAKIDCIYALLKKDEYTNAALFENNVKDLIKIACKREAEALKKNEIVLWRYSSPNHNPTSISYSCGLLSGYLEDGIRQYAAPWELAKGYSACTLIYFANCEYSRRIFTKGLDWVPDSLIESFPKHFIDEKKKASILESLTKITDDKLFVLKVIDILQEIEGSDIKNMDLKKIVHPFHDKIRPFYHCQGEKRENSQNGEVYALVLKKSMFDYLSKDKEWVSPERAVYSFGEDFHPKISTQEYEKLLNVGAKNIKIYESGKFINK